MLSISTHKAVFVPVYSLIHLVSVLSHSFGTWILSSNLNCIISSTWYCKHGFFHSPRNCLLSSSEYLIDLWPCILSSTWYLYSLIFVTPESLIHPDEWLLSYTLYLYSLTHLAPVVSHPPGIVFSHPPGNSIPSTTWYLYCLIHMVHRILSSNLYLHYLIHLALICKWILSFTKNLYSFILWVPWVSPIVLWTYSIWCTSASTQRPANGTVPFQVAIHWWTDRGDCIKARDS
jgi:hypothetical protein